MAEGDEVGCMIAAHGTGGASESGAGMKAGRLVGLALMLGVVSGCVLTPVPAAWASAAQDATQTVVSCSPNPVPVGDTTACTATVTDTASTLAPTGIVSLSSSGSGTLSNKSCELAVSAGSASSCTVDYTPSLSGTVEITASYPGVAGVYEPSSGTSLLTAGIEPTLTVVSCSPNLVQVGGQATCTATVSDMGATSSPPLGTVTLSSSGSGSFPLGPSCALIGSGGSAVCTVVYTPGVAGSVVITASYGGDGGHAASSGSSSLVVGTDLTQTVVRCSPNPVQAGASTACTATVTDTGANPSLPTGIVSLSSSGSGSFLLGSSCALAGSGGSAVCTVLYTPGVAGSVVITASYGGDGGHAASRDSGILTAVTHPTQMVVSCSPNPVQVDRSTACTATVTDTGASPSLPAGIVSLSSSGGSGSFSSRSCALAGSGGSASCTVLYTPGVAGTVVITAAYSGDGAHAASSRSSSLAVAGEVTSHQLLVALTSDTTSSTKARIPALLKAGGVTFSFKAPEAGTATIRWYPVPSGAHTASQGKPVLVASGRLVFPSSGTRHMRLKLMPAGRRLLLHARRIQLIAEGTFTPPGRAGMTARKTFTLVR